MDIHVISRREMARGLLSDFNDAPHTHAVCESGLVIGLPGSATKETAAMSARHGKQSPGMTTAF